MVLVWVTMNLDDGGRIAYAGPSQQVACRVAEALVGNRSAAVAGEIVLYGPGDGTTSVMVRQLPRNAIGPADPTKLVQAIRAVADDLHWNHVTRSWCCGPWADPGEIDDAGGSVVRLIREAAALADRS